MGCIPFASLLSTTIPTLFGEPREKEGFNVPAHTHRMPGAKIKSSRRTRRPCGPGTKFAKSTWDTTEPRGCHITG